MFTAECERPRAWVSLLKASQGVCLNAHSHTALPLTPKTAAWNILLAPAPYCIHWHPIIFWSTLFCCRSSHVWCEVDQALSWRLVGYFQRFDLFVFFVWWCCVDDDAGLFMPSSKTVPSRLVIGTTRRAMCQRIAWEQVGSIKECTIWERRQQYQQFLSSCWCVWGVFVQCGIVWMKWLNQIVESIL